MKTAAKDLIEKLQKFRLIKEDENSYELFRQLELEALEKEKEQSIGLIDQTAMFMSVVTQDEDVTKMDYEDVYNSYYNQNK